MAPETRCTLTRSCGGALALGCISLSSSSAYRLVAVPGVATGAADSSVTNAGDADGPVRHTAWAGCAG